MAREIWPFEPREEVIESLIWATDVFQAKAAEQRLALRTAPRRTFNYSHTLTDFEYAAARALVRSAQAADGFLVPDWTMAFSLGSVSPGVSVAVTDDLACYNFGTKALLWESLSKFEEVELTLDSVGVTIATVVNTYERGYLIPLWNALLIGSLTGERIGARFNQVSVEFTITENDDLGASDYSTYRGMDIMPDCPVIGSGSLEDEIAWPATMLDDGQNNIDTLRSRNIPNLGFRMRWHYFDTCDVWGLRRWVHSRRGRQKAFWMSTFGKDFEPAASISGTSVTTFALPGKSGIGHTGTFDIEIKAKDGTSYYRRVVSATGGSPIGGRSTLVLDIDSSVTLALGDVDRISYLRSTRFNADRIEFLHRAQGGVQVQVPCVEVEEPT